MATKDGLPTRSDGSGSQVSDGLGSLDQSTTNALRNLALSDLEADGLRSEGIGADRPVTGSYLANINGTEDEEDSLFNSPAFEPQKKRASAATSKTGASSAAGSSNSGSSSTASAPKNAGGIKPSILVGVAGAFVVLGLIGFALTASNDASVSSNEANTTSETVPSELSSTSD